MTAGLVLFLAFSGPAQDVQKKPSITAWDVFTDALPDQISVVWKALNDEAPVYGVELTTIYPDAITAELEITIFKRSGSRSYYDQEIRAIDVAQEGANGALADITLILKGLHKEALAWQSHGLLASKEQMSAEEKWTQGEIDLKAKISRMIQKEMMEARRTFARWPDDDPEQKVSTLFITRRDKKSLKKFLALTVDSPQSSGTDQSIVRLYSLDKLTGPKARETILELQCDVFRIWRKQGFYPSFGPRLTRFQPPAAPAGGFLLKNYLFF